MMTSNEARRIQASPFVLHKDDVRGFVYEVETGRSREVRQPPPGPRGVRAEFGVGLVLPALALQKLRFGE